MSYEPSGAQGLPGPTGATGATGSVLMYGFANGFTPLGGPTNNMYSYWINLNGLPNANLVTANSVVQATLQTPELDAFGSNTQNWLVDCFPIIAGVGQFPYLEFDFANNPVNGPGGPNTMVVAWTVVAPNGGNPIIASTTKPIP